jgi:putative Holliday junction resolvase
MTEGVRVFADKLVNKLKSNGFADTEIVFTDEALTSKEASVLLAKKGVHGKKEQKKTIDAVAAAIILQGYLG